MTTDKEILNWIESHVVELDLNIPVNQITWLNSQGHTFSTAGDNLRDCVAKAMNEDD